MSLTSKFGLTFKKGTPNDENNLKKPVKVASIFNQDSDDEEIKKASASDRFNHKYGNLKAKNLREQERVLAEDPTAYEYDSVYEQAQRQKNEKTEQQRLADVDKKPKYADKIAIAHKKRELEKLLHDENTYKKEREKEAGEFEDKEVYVTGAYKKQIEERNKFREELEKTDAKDSLTNVSDQSLWQQAFNRKLLDVRCRTLDLEPKPTSYTKNKSEGTIKTEKVDEVTTSSFEITQPKSSRPAMELKPSIYSSDEEEIPAKEKTPPKKFEELKPGLNMPKLKQEPKASTSRHSEHTYQRRSDDKSKRDNRYDRRDRNGKEEHDTVKKEEKPRLKQAKDEIEEELFTRMEKVKEIMKRKSSSEDIEEAKKRYLQRLAEKAFTLPI